MGNCCKKAGTEYDQNSVNEFIESHDLNPLGIKLTFHDFEKLKVLGKGSFGEVLLVKLKANGKYYAMKILIKKQVKLRHQEVHTKAERDLMVKINCPFIVNIKFAFQDNVKLYIITEFMQGGEMFFHLHKEKRFSNEKTRFYIIELVLAIEFLHNNKMFPHSDWPGTSTATPDCLHSCCRCTATRRCLFLRPLLPRPARHYRPG